MPISQTHSEVLLRDGEFIRRDVVEIRLGTQEGVLSKLMDANPAMVPNFSMMGDQPLHLLVQKSSIVVATELKDLPLLTNFDLSDGELRPIWNARTATSFRNQDRWPVPPQYGRTFLAVVTTREWPYDYMDCLMFTEWKGNLYRMFYPNLFDTGTVCMGHHPQWQPPGNKQSPTDVFVPTFNHFQTTSANSDLVQPYTPVIFRKDLNGKWDPIMPKDAYPEQIPEGVRTTERENLMSEISNQHLIGWRVP